ncbi:MAG: ATP-binding protein [Candidatus Thermoplasmatota archaeon]|nr:ATP-binding protein [Candidatus Thermoplasmatota archaeon]
MTEELEKSLKLVKEVMAKRKSQYSGALVSSSLVSNEDGSAISKIEVLFGDKGFLKGVEEEEKDYGKCKLTRRKLTMAKAQRTVTDLYSGKGCRIDGEEIDIKPHDLKPTGLSSSEGPASLGWPCHFFASNASQSRNTYLDGPLLSADEPLYPQLSSAERDWLCFGRVNIRGYGGTLGVNVAFPDFRARFGDLEIGADKLRIDAQTRQAKTDEILGKWYVELEGELTQSDFDIGDDTVVLPIHSLPDHVEVYMVDRETSEGLDWRSYWSGSQALEPGVSFAAHEGDIDVYLRQGENEFVEFKREFNPGAPGEFHESVSAFANTKGGVIMVGIDDNGSIVGVKDPKLEDRIRNSIDDSIQPLPEIRFARRKHRGEEILLITVEVGKDPPYMLRNQAFVRSGGTDRLAGRLELDAIYRKKTEGQSIW